MGRKHRVEAECGALRLPWFLNETRKPPDLEPRLKPLLSTLISGPRTGKMISTFFFVFLS